MSVREASHAGSWYTSSGSQLSSQLDGWLNDVKTPVKGIGAVSSTSVSQDTLPIPGARIIIAPHAGYAYSGAAAAWAYKSWDVSNAKRIFLLGPSHHFYLTSAALTNHTAYATPLGPLRIDRATTQKLHETGVFRQMSPTVDSDEHSLEMHLPYIYKMLSRSFPTEAAFPPLVPILIGSTSAATERKLGSILAAYLADPENAFVVSSDFCHWGGRFRYTYYEGADGRAQELRSGEAVAKERPIHESIRDVDLRCVDACETGSHAKWLDVLAETGNTICGRHPIGVVMAGLEEVVAALRDRDRDRDDGVRGKFRFVRYERSSLVNKVADSSVSYASAFAVL